MIDWIGVAKHALWLLGGAILLAAWSYYRWLASVGAPGYAPARQRNWILCSGAGAVLFSLGLTLTAGRMLEQVVWGILTICIAVERTRRWRLT